jgi:hypothetical protein
MKVIIIMTILAGFSIGYTEDYYILNNKKTVAYQKPDVQSKRIVYEFMEGELLRATEATNIKNIEWLQLKLPYLQEKGWIRNTNTFHIADAQNGKYYLEVIDKELIKGQLRFIQTQKCVGIKFLDYITEGYIGIQYSLPSEQWENQTVIYKVENDDLIRVIESGDLNSQLVILKNYLIILNDNVLDVYDKNQLITNKYDNVNPGGVLYKRINWLMLLPDEQYTPYDSHFDFDTNTMVLKRIVRTEPQKPLTEIDYKFSDGKFELTGTNTNGTNNAAYQDQSIKYYILTGDNVNVRQLPFQTNSVILTVLKKGARVRLIERMPEDITIGGKVGHWAYVETEVKDKAGNAVKGFVFDAYMGEEGK